MKNIKYIDSIFINCSSLLVLPDISKWNLKNVEYIDDIFLGYSSLLSFPDISNWNFHNIKDQYFPYHLEEESNNYSSIKGSENNVDSISSSDFLNNKEESIYNNINEYKIKNVSFFEENDSLISYYDNFYQD